MSDAQAQPIPAAGPDLAEVSASTRSVPSDLHGLLDQHGLHDGADSRVRLAHGRLQHVTAVAHAWVGPLTALAALVIVGRYTPWLVAMALFSGFSSLGVIMALRRSDAGHPLTELVASIAFGGALLALPWLHAHTAFDAVSWVALAGLACVLGLPFVLLSQRRAATAGVRIAIAVVPCWATVLAAVR